MLQKLRRKFILINMLLVFAVLLITFAVLCVTVSQQSRARSLETLHRTLERNGPHMMDIGNKKPLDEMNLTPVFWVLVNGRGDILQISDNSVEISGDRLSEAVAEALSSGKEEGTLEGFRLRYLIRTTPEGRKIAFADRTEEIRSITSLLLTSLAVGAGGLAAFFIISLFLSGWALRPVKQAWDQQRQFIADASHELKTPLTVILANTDILLAHPEDAVEQQRKWIENTGAEARRMKGLVDDLLFLAKSDAARIPVAHLPFSLSDTVMGCLLPFESVAYEAGVELRSDVIPDLAMTGDEGQLKQLVMILLDNACKYAQNGSDGRRVATLTLGREGDKALLTVGNSGPPIPPEHLAHLFERFYRADDSRSRDTAGGYGLGLAIAKSIVENHRGRIGVTSQEKTGTVFSVSLPLK